MLSTTPIKNSQIDDPIAVVGRGNTATAHLLRRLTGAPVVELTPYEAAMAGDDTSRYQAVVVENFEPRDRRTLSPCAVARWELSRRAGVTVVALDDGEGRRTARAMRGRVFAYSDGRPQADLTAKNVCLRCQRVEFEALTRDDLLRVRVPRGQGGLYESLAALAAAVALGVPLEQAAQRLNQS